VIVISSIDRDPRVVTQGWAAWALGQMMAYCHCFARRVKGISLNQKNRCVIKPMATVHGVVSRFFV
jgi:hypothetical protein